MIVQMIGKADNFDLVFTNISAGQWSAIVPADLSDGTYVVEIWITDDVGNVGYYTAILFMFDGVVVNLEILDDDFGVLIIADRYCIVIGEDPFTVSMKPDGFSIEYSEKMVVKVL